jgi:2-oxoisovalerate dehydrogenase E2 component (dihydrolipoyl transacylase)
MGTRVFRLPDLGEGLTEAELVRWIVAIGDRVAVDQPIAEVETAKSIVELPSPFEGIVAMLHGEEGQTIEVGSPFMEVSSEAEPEAPSTAEPDAYREEERAGSGNVLIGYGTAERHGRGRTRRRAEAIPAPRGGVTMAPPAGRASDSSVGPVAVRSPIVRSLARSRGVDLRAITPSAPDGIIRRSDVLSAPTSIPAPGAPGAQAIDLQVVSSEPLGMLRKTVSAKLSRSRSEIPEATVWVDVDATDLYELRRMMGETKPSFTAIIAKFVLLALVDFPILAGRLSEEGSSIIRYDGVNLGFAADTSRGLVVPVLRHAERNTIAELDSEIRRLADASRAGSLSPAELAGSTFTLNNYGSFGVDGSAAIINHPEVAILGMGRMIERPWVVEGTIRPRRILQLSLVFDHRVCDGGYAAGFLRRVVDAIENPYPLFGRI